MVELTAMLQGVSKELVSRVRTQLVAAVQGDTPPLHPHALGSQLEAEPAGKTLLLAATLHLELARARAAGGAMRLPVSYLQPRTALDATSHTVQVRGTTRERESHRGTKKSGSTGWQQTSARTSMPGPPLARGSV